jgi:hypothetical protein
MTSIEGVSFDDARPRCSRASYGSVPIAILGVEDLIVNKSACGRPQDLLDVAVLKALARD